MTRIEGFTAPGLLDVYERGRQRTGSERALLMLAAASPGTEPTQLSQLSVGQRDALLVELQERTFGSPLEGVVACPGCGETLELSLHPDDLRAETEGDLRRRSASDPVAWRHLAVDGYDIDVRLPTAEDLVAVEGQTDVVGGRRLLLERCMRCTKGVRRRSPASLPASVVERVGQELAVEDPRALADLTLECPSCGERNTVSFDIAAFLWREIEASVPRLLAQVGSLASAYGWSQAEILSMSAWRRQAYLELVGR